MKRIKIIVHKLCNAREGEVGQRYFNHFCFERINFLRYIRFGVSKWQYLALRNFWMARKTQTSKYHKLTNSTFVYIDL